MIFANFGVISSQASCASVIQEVNGFLWQSFIHQFCKILVGLARNYKVNYKLTCPYFVYFRAKLNKNRIIHPCVEDEILPSPAYECQSDTIVLLSQIKVKKCLQSNYILPGTKLTLRAFRNFVHLPFSNGSQKPKIFRRGFKVDILRTALVSKNVNWYYNF